VTVPVTGAGAGVGLATGAADCADEGCCGAAAWLYAASAIKTHAPPINALFFTDCPASRKLRRRQTVYES
jgi:hypothetical protein